MTLHDFMSIKEWLWGIFIGMAILFVMQLFYKWHQAPVPYQDVEILRSEVISYVPKEILIEAVFTKNDCRFVRLETFTILTGYPQQVEWEPLDNPDKQIDKLAGVQHLIIAVKPGIHSSFDALEIRTRHNCDGEIVDRTFAIIYQENIEGYYDVEQSLQRQSLIEAQ